MNAPRHEGNRVTKPSSRRFNGGAMRMSIARQGEDMVIEQMRKMRHRRAAEGRSTRLTPWNREMARILAYGLEGRTPMDNRDILLDLSRRFPIRATITSTSAPSATPNFAAPSRPAVGSANSGSSSSNYSAMETPTEPHQHSGAGTRANGATVSWSFDPPDRPRLEPHHLHTQPQVNTPTAPGVCGVQIRPARPPPYTAVSTEMIEEQSPIISGTFRTVWRAFRGEVERVRSQFRG